MSYIMVDIETDGPYAPKYSMVSIGAVVVRPGLKDTFYREIKPISEDWIPESLAISGFSREQTMKFDGPTTVMRDFAEWVNSVNKRELMFISDNAFDWMFVVYYMYEFFGSCPFGHKQQHLGSLVKGFEKNMFKGVKGYRSEELTHNALEDAMANAEVLLRLKELGLNISLR